jgi:hypothetical protein
VLPVPVAVLIVVFEVELLVPVCVKTPPDVVFVDEESVVPELEPELESLPELEEPLQVPLLLMLCQSPVISE